MISLARYSFANSVLSSFKNKVISVPTVSFVQMCIRDRIYDFAVIGGDMRQVYLANYLKNQRYQVITYATKKEGSECKEGKSFENVIREAKCIIGPVVFSKNGEITGSSSNKKMSVETLFQEMTKEQKMCIRDSICSLCFL